MALSKPEIARVNDLFKQIDNLTVLNQTLQAKAEAVDSKLWVHNYDTLVGKLDKVLNLLENQKSCNKK